ncbi:MAG: DUF2167 domain-containing protein [Rhodospirillales bacterium]|nr:DUF2167 domain-containing protein [Rhodospirillales bacterium]
MIRTLATVLGLALALQFAAPGLTAPAQAAVTTYTLKNGATLSADEADQVILDQETLDQISVEVAGGVDPTLEAYWARPDHEVYFNHEEVGYVKMDDWEDLDIDELWDSYVEGSKAQSKQFGYEVTPLRWVIQPTLNREKAVAYYAIELKFGDTEPVVNLVIYDFGRFGYEEMTLVQETSRFPVADAEAIATGIAGAYAFGPQADYGDFQEGDVVAATGAAGLIAASLGAKFGKGFIFAALIFLKKFWFLLLAIPALGWKWIRGWLGGRSGEEAA